MNFIRNIIAEKRSTRPQETGLDALARAAEFNAAYEAAQHLVTPSEDEIADGNIFAGDLDDAVVAPVEAAPVVADLAVEPAPAHEAIDEVVPQPARAQPVLSLEAGFLRPRHPVEPVAEAEAPVAVAAAKASPQPDDDSEERRLRLAMLADDAETAVPLAVDHAANGAHQPGLSEMPFVSVQTRSRSEDILTDAGVQVPPPAQGRGANRSGRVKTRLLGFNPESLGLTNPFEKEESRARDAFPVGWLVVVDGPGRGASFALHDGVSRIGRGEDQAVCLNFGDNSVSRENHLSIAYDSEQNAFYIGQSGRSNIVRLNNKPLLSTEQVRSGDQIRVGETTLRLAALCGDDFSWAVKS